MLPTLLFALITPAYLAAVQTPRLFKDINQQGASATSLANPLLNARRHGNHKLFVKVGNVILISAWTPATGQELWASSGSPAGTRFLKDLHPGIESSHPQNPMVTTDGKRVFFGAIQKESATLWVTDGTSAGTRLVDDKLFPMSIAPIGSSSVVFSAWTESLNRELYISDGTATGTKLLKDIMPGSKASWPRYLCATKDRKRVFFTAMDPVIGFTLWVTDGTSSGTHAVKDLRMGQTIGDIGPPTLIGQNRVIFSVTKSSPFTATTYELWISDGTARGTIRLLSPATSRVLGFSTMNALTFGNKVVFTARELKTGWEPYITDGTVQGTKRLIDTAPGRANGLLYYPSLDSTGKKVYWSSQVAIDRYRIFVSDGTPAGTKMFTPKNVGMPPPTICESGGKIYFMGQNVTPGTGRELCVSDGTLKGTKTLRDSAPGPAHGSAMYLTRLGGSRIAYTAWNSKLEAHLWIMIAGTAFIRIDFGNAKGRRTQSSNPGNVVRFGKRIAFLADDGKFGREPWISDGSTAGTRMIKDVYPGSSGSYSTEMALLGDKVVFNGYDTGLGYVLFRSDGTRDGTKFLASFPSSTSYDQAHLTSIGRKVFFAHRERDSGWEPWVTDGTSAGTRRIKELVPGVRSSNPGYFAGLGDKVVFRAFTSKTGSELFMTDGTATGTRLLKDIYPGNKSSNPSDMVFCAGRVYFSATSPVSGRELWVTDFTSKGTTLVKDILSGSGSSWPADLSTRNGRICFSAYTAATGFELFQSDGTAAGTSLFLDYKSGPSSSFPTYISALGSRKVYFSAFTKGKGFETIVTDGTVSGTKVLDLYPGERDGYGYFDDSRTHHIALGSQVFLRGIHPLWSSELFTVDNGATAEPLGSPYASTWIQGSDPVLGKTAKITGGTTLKNAVHVTILGSLAERPIRVGTVGFAHFDLTRYYLLIGATQGVGFQYSLPIPNSLRLKGLQVVFQTLAFDATNLAGTLELSDGLGWSLGH